MEFLIILIPTFIILIIYHNMDKKREREEKEFKKPKKGK
jgi:large-conductance mechanosensitive channel